VNFSRGSLKIVFMLCYNCWRVGGWLGWDGGGWPMGVGWGLRGNGLMDVLISYVLKF